MPKSFKGPESFVFYLLSSVRITLSERMQKIVTEFVRFGMVGLSNTAVSYLVYVLTLLCLKSMNLLVSFQYLAALALSFVLSVLWSFYFSRRYVFTGKKKSSIVSSLAKTYVSYALTGLVLSGILLWLLIDVLKISDFIAPLIVLFITVPLNFVLNRCWSFR